jgi:KDO2-lipid IV(A) lauroyltransferase
MTRASVPRRLGEAALGMVLFAPVALARPLPYRWRIAFTGWLTARIVAPLAGYDRRVRDNLAHVWPDLPEAEVRHLMRAVPERAGRSMAELHAPTGFKARVQAAPVRGPGLDAVRSAAERGRPVVFVTGHLGSFNAARLAMIAQGVDLGAFYRPMHNRWFNRRYVAAMAALSEPIFEQGRRGMRQMLAHLGRGDAVLILTDVRAQDGVPLDFLGKPALSPLTAAKLALKFEAPLVPVWGIRGETGLDFEILVEAPVQTADPVSMTQEVNDRLARQVRAHPDQWFWVHRRWQEGSAPPQRAAPRDVTARVPP